MWKYIVTWIIVTQSPTACPDPPIQYDEFGRRVSQPYTTAQICLSNDTTYKEKVFDSRKEAIYFIKRGQDKKAAGWNPIANTGELSNFKLDSIPLAKYNCTHPETQTTMVYCDPPIEGCNSTKCLRCGKKWQSY